ncbi:hypothetical protein KR222_003553 [Zaprionus bogoriensis]|nr:hypothetical protein KR222_003553 [Zaprionus bogoriensis]
MTKDEWSAEEELQLFHAMDGLRPVGINKHFYMSCIAERLSKSLNREMPSELIWKHLSTMYKLKELDEQECLPFPNEEREFSLPEQDYATFLSKKSAPNGDETADAQASLGTPTAPAATENTTSKSNANPGNEKKPSLKGLDLPKRPAKRTRGSMSNESISPSTTPPPMPGNKRRRI